MRWGLQAYQALLHCVAALRVGKADDAPLDEDDWISVNPGPLTQARWYPLEILNVVGRHDWVPGSRASLSVERPHADDERAALDWRDRPSSQSRLCSGPPAHLLEEYEAW